MNRSPAANGQPASVSRFEYNLLRILRFLLGSMPAEQAMTLIYARFPSPPCLSPACVRVLEDTLARGSVLTLVRWGGWRQEKFLRGLKPTEGRVWERHPLEERELAFSAAVPDFLMWLTSDRPIESYEIWDVGKNDPLTAADELFFALAFDTLRVDPEIANALGRLRVFRSNGLCWLLNTAELAQAGIAAEAPSFEPWMTGTRSVILECLQTVLARRWTKTDRTKCLIADWQQMQQLGAVETAGLTGYLRACEKYQRQDLARFVLETARATLAAGDLSPSSWTGGLKINTPVRLADRLDIQRAALIIPQSVELMENWENRARSVGYFDEEYAASQLWKAEWEKCGGASLVVRARSVLEQLEPFRV